METVCEDIADNDNTIRAEQAMGSTDMNVDIPENDNITNAEQAMESADINVDISVEVGNDDNVIIHDNIGTMLDNVEIELYKKLKKRIKWKKVTQDAESERPVLDWTGDIESISDGDVLDPIDYFRRFFDAEVLRMICNESNRFAMQLDINILLLLDIDELEKYIGIGLYMSLVKLTRQRRYWSPETQVSAITETMSRNRFERITRFLHFFLITNRPQRGIVQNMINSTR